MAVAEPIALSLTGTSEFSLWAAGTLTKAQNPGCPSFSGGAAWPAPIYASAGTGEAWLDKIANGTGGGGPFPSQAGLYFGGTSAQVNRYGGALRIGDDAPVAGVNTIALQIEIGQAFGYDFSTTTHRRWCSATPRRRELLRPRRHSRRFCARPTPARC